MHIILIAHLISTLSIQQGLETFRTQLFTSPPINAGENAGNAPSVVPPGRDGSPILLEIKAQFDQGSRMEAIARIEEYLEHSPTDALAVDWYRKFLFRTSQFAKRFEYDFHHSEKYGRSQSWLFGATMHCYLTGATMSEKNASVTRMLLQRSIDQFLQCPQPIEKMDKKEIAVAVGLIIAHDMPIWNWDKSDEDFLRIISEIIPDHPAVLAMEARSLVRDLEKTPQANKEKALILFERAERRAKEFPQWWPYVDRVRYHMKFAKPAPKPETLGSVDIEG